MHVDIYWIICIILKDSTWKYRQCLAGTRCVPSKNDVYIHSVNSFYSYSKEHVCQLLHICCKAILLRLTRLETQPFKRFFFLNWVHDITSTPNTNGVSHSPLILALYTWTWKTRSWICICGSNRWWCMCSEGSITKKAQSKGQREISPGAVFKVKYCVILLSQYKRKFCYSLFCVCLCPMYCVPQCVCVMKLWEWNHQRSAGSNKCHTCSLIHPVWARGHRINRITAHLIPALTLWASMCIDKSEQSIHFTVTSQGHQSHLLITNNDVYRCS